MWVTKNVIKTVSHDSEAGGYRIAHATETTSNKDEKKIDNVDSIRLKVRYSVPVLDGKWRLDVTCIKHLGGMANLQHSREQFIFPMKDFSTAPVDQSDWLEFEFEYTGDGDVLIDDDLLHKMYGTLLNWIPGSEHNDWIRWVARMIHTTMIDKFISPGSMRLVHKFNYLLPRAREITLQEWRMLYHDMRGKITVRQKIDGDRQLLVIYNGSASTFAGGSVKHDVKVNHTFDNKLYIFDTEFLDGRWYVLHPLVWADEPQYLHGDETRLRKLTTGGDIAMCQYEIVGHDDIKSSVVKLWGMKDIKLDGLLITLQCDESYWMQTVIKWKPSEETTIDFLIIDCPQTLEGKAPYVNDSDHLYLLLVGTHEPPSAKLPAMPSIRGYRPTLFSPPQNPYAHIWKSKIPGLNKKICEMRRDDNNWILKKIRADKISILEGGTDMGNNSRTAIDTFTKYYHPFRLCDLYTSANESSTVIPPEFIPPSTTHLLLYRPPQDLVVPRGIKHVASVGPMAIRGIRDVQEPKTLNYDMPSEFIGGAQLVISFQLPPSGIKRWLKTMQIIVAAGGTLIHMGDDDPDPGSEFKNVRPKTWTRVIAGNRVMTPAEVHKENPHTVGNPEAGFVYKYSRQKTKEMTTYIGEPRKLQLMEDPARGELLCYVEFLSKFPAGTQVYMHKSVPDVVRKLFPKHKFTNEESKDVEVLIAHDWTDDMLQKMTPRESLVFYQPPPNAQFQIPKSRIMLIPYQTMGSNSVMLWITGPLPPRTGWWNIQTAIWNGEMRYFHSVIRPNGYRYQKPRGLETDFDNCYDCRSEIYILGKYIKEHGSVQEGETAERAYERAIDSLDV